MAIAAFYWLTFAAFALPAVLLELDHGSGLFGSIKGASGRVGRGSPEYVRFRNNYLMVFALMMAGDWLQGPYIYHLYEYYGFSVRDIGRLFIMGFASSAVFGTVAGALADKYGRKRASLLYVLTYAASCATKHSSSYNVLLVGRLLGGVSTSLLFSVFEAWAVAAHTSRGFEESLLADLFTKAVMLGNGVMAIASGLAGSWLVQGLGLGPVAPFDAAIVVLIVGGVIVAATWQENCGGESTSLARQFYSAAATIAKDERVALLGVMQALFEASMYTFVFLWTPALNPHTFVPSSGNGSSTAASIMGRSLTSTGALPSTTGEGAETEPHLPHGLVFAIFMTASMVGTALAGRLMASWRLETVLQGVFWAGAVLLFVPVMYHTKMADHAMPADVFEGEPHVLEVQLPSAPQHSPSLGRSSGNGSSMSAAALGGPVVAAQLDMGGRVQLLAFCGFEVLIGLFWPSMMALRARYVPEEQRSTIINIFRIPLNGFVCIILWKVSEFPLGVIFGLCCLFLVAAAMAQARLAFITMQQPAGKRPSSPKPPRRGPIAGCLAGGALISSLFPGVGKRPSSATALVAPSLNDREDSDSSEKGLAGVAVNGSHISAVSPHQGMKS